MTARSERCIRETLAGRPGRMAAPYRWPLRAARRSAALFSPLPVARCAHDRPPPALPFPPPDPRAERPLSSNVGQNYPYTSESEAERARANARLVAQHPDLGPKVAAETTPPHPEAERHWVWT